MGISEHVSTASACNAFERSWRKKVEAHKRLMRKAYKLLWTEITQTDSTSPRIGTISAGHDLPSYEQSMCAPRAGTGKIALGTRNLSLNTISLWKYNERKWRCWWNSLTELRPAMTGEDARNLQERFLAMHCCVSMVDEGMREVSTYLQGVEHGARKQPRSSQASRGKQISTVTQKKRRTKHNPNQSRLEKKQNTKAVSAGKICSGMISWISRPFSFAVRNGRRSGHHERASKKVLIIEETDLGKEKIADIHAEVLERTV